jgi:plastocyanin
MRNALIAAGIIVVLGGGYYMYNKDSMPMDDQTVTETPVATTTEMVATTTAATSTDALATSTAPVKEFSVTNKGLLFSEKEMSVKKGDLVKITYTNGGGTHDFRVDGYNVGTQKLSDGKAETFEFTADKAGTFEYFCSVGKHRAMGMKGTLTVTE